MILSLHLPKTAGTSFRQMLQTCYGKRLYLDYGDLIGDESESSKAIRAARAADLTERRDYIASHFDVIHGHFYASKYVSLFSNARFITTLRNPLTRLPSHYQFLKRCDVPGHPLANHPLVSTVRSQNMSFDDFIRWEYMENLCSRLLDPLEISDFHFVGIQEFHDLSAQVLLKKLGFHPPSPMKANVNPEPDGYPLTLDQSKTIARLHRVDFEMYHAAMARFHEELKK